MGCNCKQIKKVGKKFKVFETPFYEKKGLKKILGWFKHSLWHTLGALIALILMVIIMPIIVIIVFFNILFNGKSVLNLPLKKLLTSKDN